MRPLEGVLVVALEQAVAGPYATRQLADLGARVIKIERPGGDFARGYDRTVHGLSSYFVWCNRSKESITLDLKSVDDARVLHSLLSRADIFLHNLAPGAVDRLGFGAEGLRPRHPRLIICRISGYGPDGPYRDRKAYDLLVQCEAGLVSATGTQEQPSRAGISAADIAAGMYAYSGILTALYSRERTGVGSLVDIAMLDALGEWMGAPAYFTSYGGTELPRSGDRHPHVAPYGSFLSRDGERVFLAIQNDREWHRFCTDVLEKPGLAADPRFATNVDRVHNIDDLTTTISGVLGQFSASQIRELLDRAEIANARLNTVQELVDHPQLAARHRFREVAMPGGTAWVMLPPAVISGQEPALGPVPAAGEHTEAIKREFLGDPT
jgi:itaconate CoA-transferase